MRRWTTIVAFFGVVALVGGCSGGGGATAAPAASVPAASAPAASAAASEPAARRPSAAASAAADSAACNPPRQDGVTLSFTSFGGVYQEAQRKAWLEPYTELTGVQFTEDENSSNATIKAQVESGQVTWDVVDVGNDFGLEANKDLLEPLDYTIIPRDEMNQDLGVSDWRVPDITYGVVLGYNTDATKGAVPEGWADFFDTTKIPGKRGVWDYSEGGMFEFALMADGVAPADLYPLDLPRATAKLDTIKDDIVFWNVGRRVAGADRLRRGRDEHDLERPRLERQEHRQEAGRDPVEPADRHGGLPGRAQGVAQQGRGHEVHRVHGLCGEQRQAVRVHPVRADQHEFPGQSDDGERPVGLER